jgi:Ribosomal RNA adenine dimethylase
VHRFDRTDFAPPPRVDAVILRLQKRGPPLVPSAHAGMYRDFVVSVFAGRHRLVGDTLHALVGWQRARRVVAGLGLDPAATPSEVSFACWLDLFELFKAAAANRTALRVGRAPGPLSSVCRRHRQSAIPPVRSFRAATVLWDSRVLHAQSSWSAPWIVRGECVGRLNDRDAVALEDYRHPSSGATYLGLG